MLPWPLSLTFPSHITPGVQDAVGHRHHIQHTAHAHRVRTSPIKANALPAAAPGSSPPGPAAPGAAAAAGGASSRRSGRELWGLVRAAAVDKRLALLGRSVQYSTVASVFSALFPEDYDRVSAVGRMWTGREMQEAAATVHGGCFRKVEQRNVRALVSMHVLVVDWVGSLCRDGCRSCSCRLSVGLPILPFSFFGCILLH